MTRTNTLYEACHELFDNYPPAVTAVDCGETIRSMVLMLQDSDAARFFVLSHFQGGGGPFYSLCPWPSGSIVEIETDGAAPDGVVHAVTLGVPIPRDGSLFGWACGETITALVTVYAEYTPEFPEPSWTVMPLAGSPEAQWPPFTGERLLGHWFWEHYRAGSVVPLSRLVAGTPDTVFWADTKAILGSDCCVVARDIRSPQGSTLPRGRYVYFQALRAGNPVPSLKELLADTSKIDLTPRFQETGYSDG